MRGEIVNSFRDFDFFDHFPYKMIIFPRILENIFFRRLKNVVFSKIQIRFRKFLIFWKAEDLSFRLVTFLGCVCWTQKSPERNMWKIVDFQKIDHFLGGWEKNLRKKFEQKNFLATVPSISFPKNPTIKDSIEGARRNLHLLSLGKNHTPPCNGLAARMFFGDPPSREDSCNGSRPGIITCERLRISLCVIPIATHLSEISCSMCVLDPTFLY